MLDASIEWANVDRLCNFIVSVLRLGVLSRFAVRMRPVIWQWRTTNPKRREHTNVVPNSVYRKAALFQIPGSFRKAVQRESPTAFKIHCIVSNSSSSHLHQPATSCSLRPNVGFPLPILWHRFTQFSYLSPARHMWYITEHRICD